MNTNTPGATTETQQATIYAYSFPDTEYLYIYVANTAKEAKAWLCSAYNAAPNKVKLVGKKPATCKDCNKQMTPEDVMTTSMWEKDHSIWAQCRECYDK